VDGDASRNSIRQGSLNLSVVTTENEDFDAMRRTDDFLSNGRTPSSG
jgi:hypothetical protein